MTTDQPSLRSYLASHRADVLRIEEPLSIDQDVTALQHALARRGRQPVLLIERPRLRDGSIAAQAVVTNLFASRARIAEMLGLADHRDAAARLADLVQAPIAPEILPAGGAPVQEVVREGDAIDLTRLPFLRQHRLDVGPYVTAGHCVTVDPESGIDNSAIQRCWVREPGRTSFYPYGGSHNARNVERWWAKGEDCPIAIWIGHHPAIVMGANAKLDYPRSHWGQAGALAGAPVRLVPTLTHGDALMVPADAKIVIEGVVPRGRLDVDGPFAEYTGHTGPQILTPTIEVTKVTHRRDFLLHDIGGGLEDHLVPDNMAMEGRIFAMAKAVAPSLINVHVPFSGRRFHAYLQFRDPRRGEARDALTAVLAFRRVRNVFAFDEDVDIFDDREVMCAIASRAQWHRDLIKIDGLTHGNLDPSLPPGANTVTKLGVDATLPPAPSPGMPKPFAPRNETAPAARDRAEALLARLDSEAKETT